jgi:ABC-2 type transport system ATP-binding protein
MEQIADTIGFITKGTLIEETPLSDLQEKYPAGLEKYFMEKREEHYDKII